MAVPIEQPFDEAAVIVDHMLEIPVLLLVVFVGLFGVVRERFLVFVHEAAVADVRAAVAHGREWPMFTTVAAIAPSRLVDEAVVLAMPAFEMAVVIAPPIAVAAIVGATPPADIVGAVARTVDVVAAMFAKPAMPAAIVVTTETLAAFAVDAATLASLPFAVAVVEMDGGHGIERIKQDGIVEGHAAIFVGAAGLARYRARVQHQAGGNGQRAQQPEPSKPE
jgi:hypothetical protein